MGHSKELLEQIASDLRRSYPSPEYRFVFEKPLRLSDRRNQPDIQVFEGQELCAVVEIGYTRPDKLRLYHEQKIPDIRWYDKRGNLVNNVVVEKASIVTRTIKYAVPKDHFFTFAGWVNTGPCMFLLEEWDRLAGIRERGTLFQALKATCKSEILLEHEVSVRDAASLDDAGLFAALDSGRYADLCNTMFCDGIHAFLISYDDLCGGTALIPFQELEAHYFWDDTRDFLKRRQAQIRAGRINNIKIPLIDLPEFLADKYDVSFDYEFLDKCRIE